jgi:Protein of unknown function (DUF2563)
MFVDTAMLHSGAGEAYRASEHAQDGANHLSAAALVAGMFGEFADAEEFYDAISDAHAHHVKALQSHQENLGKVGDRAHHVASSFSAMDNNNAKVLREV